MSDLYKKASLVMLPQAVDTSKVYSIKPENRDGDFTFTRSSYATRVNADGNIEKETQNLLLQSNSFDTTWTLDSGMTLTSGQSGYDGSSDAWLFAKPGASYREMRQTISLSGVNTYSIYAKSGTLSKIVLRFISTSGNHYARFNLSTGAVISTTGNVFETNIEDIGSGWYRCSATANVTATQVYVYPDTESNNTAGNIYIQDAQLEQGLVARDYIETTTAAVEGGITDNVPRLDYTDSSCPALLLEPQRTNLFTQSEYFGGSEWAKSQSSVSLSSEISPEGYENAYEFNENSANNAHRLYESFSATSGTNYTLSVFAKYNSRKYLQLTFNSTQFGSAQYATFDLEDGEVSGSASGTATITEITDGWYKCTFTADALSSATSNAFMILSNVATGRDPSYLGDGSGVYIYGAQIEAGSYATSYIPTYGSSVTRNVDVGNATGIGDYIGDNEGVLFVDTNYTDIDFFQTMTLNDGNISNRIGFYTNQAGSQLRTFLVKNSVSQMDTFIQSISHNQQYKIAIKYDNGEIKTFVNGVLKNTSTNKALPVNLSKASWNNGSTTNWSSPLNNYMIFPTALTDQELIDLTTI